MKPGVSTRTTSGRPNALQVRTNRAAFCAASASITPPRYRGWLAMTPTGRPSRRATAHTMLRAKRGEISICSPPSESARTTVRMSYTRRPSAGTIASSSASGGGAGGLDEADHGHPGLSGQPQDADHSVGVGLAERAARERAVLGVAEHRPAVDAPGGADDAVPRPRLRAHPPRGDLGADDLERAGI